MNKLKSIYEYNIGNTPMVTVDDFEFQGCLHIKMECYNQNKSIKDRAAYYMMKALEESNQMNEDLQIVESTSGNLGMSLSFFANILGIPFTCLVDPTIMKQKRVRLTAMGSSLVDVKQGPTDKDYRCARIRIANEMNQQDNIYWVNQYANPANTAAHYNTTGPEIWNQRKGKVDYVICAMGSGGTISGISKYMKEMHPQVKVIGVEPYGSTIYGTVEQTYLSAGAGLVGKSELLENCSSFVDKAYVVRDEDAIEECRFMLNKEGISIGITSGMNVHIARKILQEDPRKHIVVISPDNADSYIDYIKD